MPLKFGLPSDVRAGRATWPAVRVTDTETTALTAADARATATIELLNQRRMTISSAAGPAEAGPYRIYLPNGLLSSPASAKPRANPPHPAVHCVAGSGPRFSA